MRKYRTHIVSLLIIVMAGVAVNYYQKASALKADPDAAAKKEAAEIVSRAGRLILLPTGETPTVASINDVEKLKSQVFFAKAKSGDKVIFYQNSKRAYLYDPVVDKILEVAPITLSAKPEVKPVK